MPFIEMPIGDVGEQYAAPSGTYDLRIVKVTEEASKKKREEEGEGCDPNMLVVTTAIVSDEHPDAAPFRSWFMYPDGGDYDEMRMRELKRLLYWFGVDFQENGFNTEDLENAEASNIEVEREVNDAGREFNTMNLAPIPSDGEGTEEEAAPEEEAAEEEVEEEAAEEETAEEEVEEEAPPAPRRQTAKPKAAAKVAAKKPAPKAAAKKPGRR